MAVPDQDILGHSHNKSAGNPQAGTSHNIVIMTGKLGSE